MAEPFVPSFLKDLPLALDALRCAIELHRGQRRDVDAAPFVVHPLEVAALLHNNGQPEHVVAAGLLHDTVEDTRIGVEQIERRFGPDVAGIVAAVTDDGTIAGYEERKAALRAKIPSFVAAARAVYAADKVAKVRELRAQATCDPEIRESVIAGTHPKLRHYTESLRLLEQSGGDDPLVRQLRFELELLQALPPGSGDPGDPARGRSHDEHPAPEEEHRQREPAGARGHRHR